MARDSARLSHPARCGRYHPGHETHWIHARKAGESRAWEMGLVVANRWTVVFDIWTGHETRPYRYHHPETIHRLIDEHGPLVVINDEWHMLRIDGQLLNVACVRRG